MGSTKLLQRKLWLAVGEFLGRLGQRNFTKLLLQLLRDDCGKDVDSANRDILNAGGRTGGESDVR